MSETHPNAIKMEADDKRKQAAVLVAEADLLEKQLPVEDKAEEEAQPEAEPDSAPQEEVDKEKPKTEKKSGFLGRNKK